MISDAHRMKFALVYRLRLWTFSSFLNIYYMPVITSRRCTTTFTISNLSTQPYRSWYQHSHCFFFFAISGVCVLSFGHQWKKRQSWKKVNFLFRWSQLYLIDIAIQTKNPARCNSEVKIDCPGCVQAPPLLYGRAVCSIRFCLGRGDHVRSMGLS